MKKLLLTTALVAFASTAHAQVATTGNSASDNADATAKVVKPISLTKNQDMDFGSFIINDAIAAITANDTGLSVTGQRPSGTFFYLGSDHGITRLTDGHQAVFTADGEDGYRYDIMLPDTISLTGSNGGTMDVTPVLHQLDDIFRPTAPAIKVFGRIDTSNTQIPGSYNGSFNMTVQYQ